MQLVIADQARAPISYDNTGHERYGPYFVFSQYRRTLSFGGTRSFELLIAALTDPRVCKAARRRLNGIAVIWHGPQHEVIILEGLEAVERANLKHPTVTQVAEFWRIAHMPWDDFSAFCRASQATCPTWRAFLPWSQLNEIDLQASVAAAASSPGTNLPDIAEAASACMQGM